LLGRHPRVQPGETITVTEGNRTHAVDERCTRWLLMTRDRVGADAFDLTQEILAVMLAVRRPSVSTAAGVLQRAWYITYHQGRITVLDRAGPAPPAALLTVLDRFARLIDES
jgi:CRP-like cAMP-binding protein